MTIGRTLVVANWKKGNNPDDHISKSRRSPSAYTYEQASLRLTCTHTDDPEDVRIDVQSPLVDAGRQGRIKTLSESLGHYKFAWYFGVRYSSRLESLGHCKQDHQPDSLSAVLREMR
jgi:hypothetical protein